MTGNSKADDRRDFNEGGGTGVKLGAIREAKPRGLLVRLAFGAFVSVVAAVASTAFGPRAGGLFLAFPAVLPAALTFVEKKDGDDAVHGETIGAVGGALGMVGFAAVLVGLLVHAGAPAALLGALAAWVVVALGMYMALRRLL